MTYFPATGDVHRGDPNWDWDENEPTRGTEYLVRSALVRTLPVQRVAVASAVKA